MKLAFSCISLAVVATTNLSSAFSPSLQRGISPSTTAVPRGRVVVFSSQWDDEDEDDVATTTSRATFDEAGQSLKDSEDQDRMDKMGDYDANPAYNSADIDRVREAIRARTQDLGIEKSKVTIEAIKEAEARAKAAAANRGGGQILDLSQISQTAPRGEDDNVPAMFYEPENEMSEEEMREADPVGQLSIPEQIMNEFKEATWPTPGAAIKEVFLLIAIVVFTSVLIINWDNLLRDLYTNLGFIPRPEDITSGSENMVLPEGWTNGMSEDDFMNFQDDVASAAGAAAKSAFPDL